MNRNSLTTAVVAGIAGVVGIANMANAVNLNPDGLGQTLLYPYYTVNAGQQTLLSVVNTTGNAKAVKVRFLEGYNSREVLDFNLFLSKYDVWTATVFKLSDAGVSGTGAGIFSLDNTCTAPAFGQTAAGVPAGFQPFLHYAYTSPSDGGPTGDSRTNEGHFEMISMGDIDPASNLYADITHKNGVPPDCADAEGDFEAASFAAVTAPTSGLFGAAAVVNVGHGTYYTYNADALDGFTATTLARGTGSLEPSLGNVNDANPNTATAFVFNNGSLITAVYPTNVAPSQGIDAVSAVFSANNLYNQWQSAANGSVGSDWVVTFPTKRFYVDPPNSGSATVIPPFESVFKKGLSCDVVGISLFDREERTTSTPTCGFSPCPPGQPPSSLCHETNVVTFGGPSILGSTLTSNIATSALGSNGWLALSFTDATHGGTTPAADPHAMRADSNGNVFYGLPVTGFEAENFVNGNVGGVLANYSGVYRHRSSRFCLNGQAACS